MTLFRLLTRTFRQSLGTNAGIAFGVFLIAALVTGAFLAKDVLDRSTAVGSTYRTGRTAYSVHSHPRWFQASLAERLAEKLETNIVPAIQSRGMCGAPDKGSAASFANVYGVAPGFWAFAPDPTTPEPEWGDQGVVVNQTLAARLGVKAGDRISIRLQPRNEVPHHFTYAPESLAPRTVGATVRAVLPASAFGHFDLRGRTSSDPAVFFPLDPLSRVINAAGRANTLLVAQPRGRGELGAFAVRQALDEVYRLEDAELRLEAPPDSGFYQLETSRLYLNLSIEAATMGAVPTAYRVLTYPLEGVAKRDSEDAAGRLLVTATDRPDLTGDVREGEVVLSAPLAEALNAGRGALLDLKFLAPLRGRAGQELSTTTMVSNILAEDSPLLDPYLVPPELAMAEATDGQRPRHPLRAVVPLRFGQRLWGNRHHAVSAIRFPSERIRLDDLRTWIERELSARTLGVTVRRADPLRGEPTEQMEQLEDTLAVVHGVLLVGAVLLTGFFIHRLPRGRAQQSEVLRTFGFTGGRIRMLMIVEVLLLAVVGIGAGLVAGVFYGLMLTVGIHRGWPAVAPVPYEYLIVSLAHLAVIGAATFALLLALLIGLLRPAGVSSGALNLTQRGNRQFLLASRFSVVPGTVLSALLLVAAVVPVAMALGASKGSLPLPSAVEAAALVFAAALAFSFTHVLRAKSTQKLSIVRLALRNHGRHFCRSIALMACIGGALLTALVVGVCQKTGDRVALDNKSGTGGYAYYGCSALPIPLDHVEDALSSDSPIPAAVRKRLNIVPLLARATNDATCGTRPSHVHPQIVGVDPAALADRDAFQFRDSLAPETWNEPAESAAGATGAETSRERRHMRHGSTVNPWRHLDGRYGEDVVPVIADAHFAENTLGMRLGDTMDMMDEAGGAFKIELVATLERSVLHGKLILSRTVLAERFPSANRASILLVDVPSRKSKEIAAGLQSLLGDFGLSLVPAQDRLDSVLEIRRTRSAIAVVAAYAVMVIGGAILTIAVARSGAARRRESTFLYTLGFSRRQVRTMLVAEYARLLALVLVQAVLGAVVGLFVVALKYAPAVPWLSVIVPCAAILGAIFLFVHLFGTRASAPGGLVDLHAE